MKLDNRGSTLVEITAGFLMLVVIMASFIKIINLSSEMTESAVDMKKNNLEFDRKYYDGLNYNIDGKTAFRSDDSTIVNFVIDNVTVPVSLTELHKQTDGDYFDEWNENTEFKVVIPSDAEPMELNNIKVFHIENIRDYGMARVGLYRYKYIVP